MEESKLDNQLQECTLDCKIQIKSTRGNRLEDHFTWLL